MAGEKGRELDEQFTELRQLLMIYDRRGIAGLDSFGLKKIERQMDKTWRAISEYKRELSKERVQKRKNV